MSHVGSRVDEDNGGVASPEALGFGGQDDEDIHGLVPEPEVLSNFSFLPDSSEFLQVLDFLSEEAEPNDVSSSAAREQLPFQFCLRLLLDHVSNETSLN